MESSTIEPAKIGSKHWERKASVVARSRSQLLYGQNGA